MADSSEVVLRQGQQKRRRHQDTVCRAQAPPEYCAGLSVSALPDSMRSANSNMYEILITLGKARALC